MSRYVIAATALLGLCAGGSFLRADAPDRPAKRQPRVSVGIMIEATPRGAEHEGAVIRDVAPDSAAARAGLKKGDVITRADNREVDDPETLINILAEHQPGDKVTFHVLRDGEEKNIPVRLEERRAGRTTESGSSAREAPGRSDREGSEGPSAERPSAFLGVQTVPMDELTERMKQRLNITGDRGLVVLDVVPDSPAAEAGLRHGDVITGVNGHEVTTPRDLRERINQVGAGKEVSLEVLRGDEKKKLTARLEEPPVEFRGVLPTGGLMPPEGGPELPLPLFQRRRMEELERRVEELQKRVRELEQHQNDSRK